MSTPLIELVDIRKSYGGVDTPKVDILHGISLRIYPVNSSPSSAPPAPASRP